MSMQVIDCCVLLIDGVQQNVSSGGFSGFSGEQFSSFGGLSGISSGGFSGFSGVTGISGYRGVSGYMGSSGFSGYVGASTSANFSMGSIVNVQDNEDIFRKEYNVEFDEEIKPKFVINKFDVVVML
jgi:hypothetical protein